LLRKGHKRVHKYHFSLWTTALGIVGERRKELCAVERSTAANAEPRKARPLLPITAKNYSFFAVMGSRGNAQIKKKTSTHLLRAFTVDEYKMWLLVLMNSFYINYGFI